VRHQLERLPASTESNNYVVHSSQTHQKDPQDPGASESTLNHQIHHPQPQTHLQAPWQIQVQPGCLFPSSPNRPYLAVKEKI